MHLVCHVHQNIVGERAPGQARRQVLVQIALEEVNAEIGDVEVGEVLPAVRDGDDGHFARIRRGDGIAGLCTAIGVSRVALSREEPKSRTKSGRL